MSGVRLISCLRFAMQLLIGECVYTFAWERTRDRLFHRLGALVGYFAGCALVYSLFSQIPGHYPLAYILYYACLFALSLGCIKLCFAVKWDEILFAGVCGYATQHIAFAVITIINQLL